MAAATLVLLGQARGVLITNPGFLREIPADSVGSPPDPRKGCTSDYAQNKVHPAPHPILFVCLFGLALKTQILCVVLAALELTL